MKFVIVVALALNMQFQTLNAQRLESIVPVTSTLNNLPDSVSFVFAATDNNYFKGLPATYVSSLQVIDARTPWPPRWFMPAPDDPEGRMHFAALMPLNASVQDNKLSFYTVLTGANVKPGRGVGYVICNEKAEPVDTVYGNPEMEPHEFRITPDNEKIYFDEVMEKIDARDLFGRDTILKITYEKISIDDKNDSLVFSWNPLKQLGLGSFYKPYRDMQRIVRTNNSLGWSHGNSACLDYDGNILYSFKHIGIGKISRSDGHVIWRIDRNKLRPNQLSDTIPIFLQHDFKAVKDEKGNIVYTVLSNGDSMNPPCQALQFSANELKGGQTVFRLLKKIVAPAYIEQTSGGNYDLETNGNYLLNYGLYQDDSVASHLFFEYRNKDGKPLASYTVPSRSFYYRVHKVSNWGPHRPDVIGKKGKLKCTKKETGTWYKMDGEGLKSLKPVFQGTSFKPEADGYYCVAVKSGVGYAVSKPFKYGR